MQTESAKEEALLQLKKDLLQLKGELQKVDAKVLETLSEPHKKIVKIIFGVNEGV